MTEKRMREMLTWVDWTHPSVRDLVIDELASDNAERQLFLSRCSLSGIGLALSQAGGVGGRRDYPLLVTEEDWSTLCHRVSQIVPTLDSSELMSLMRTLLEASKRSAAEKKRGSVELPKHLPEVVDACLAACRLRWESASERILADTLELYYSLSLVAHPLPASPVLQPTWEELIKGVQLVLQESEKVGHLETPQALMEWLRFSRIIAKNEPRFLRQVGFPDSFSPILTKFLETCQSELGWELVSPSVDEVQGEIEWLNDLADAVRDVERLAPKHKREAKGIATSISAKVSRLEDQTAEMSQDVPDEHDAYDDRVDSITAIASIFDDL